MTENPQDFGSKAKSLAASLASRGKAAALLVAKQAERTKVATLDLGSAYQALGSHLFTSGSHRTDFSDLYQRVESLLRKVEAMQAAPVDLSKPEGFLGKAKAAAQDALHAAQRTELHMRANHALGELGKAVYDRLGPQSGPEEITRPVADNLARLQAIDAEIARLSQAAWATSEPSRPTDDPGAHHA